MSSVFLSGGIEKILGAGKEWRLSATKYLEKAGYKVVSPLVDFDQQVFRDPNEIVHRNFHLQQDCDLVLAEMSYPNRNYIGTIVELVKARDWDQPCIVWADQSYWDRMYLKYYSTKVVPSLLDGLEYIKKFYPVEKQYNKLAKD